MKKFILGLVLLSAAAAHASTYAVGKNEIGIDGGIARAAGNNDFKDGLKREGAVGGVHYMRFVTPHLGIGAQADYIWWSERFSDGLSEPDGLGGYTYLSDNGTIDYRDTSLMAIARVNLVSEGIAIPYIMAGIGGNRFSSEINATAGIYNTTLMYSQSASASSNANSTQLSVCAGAGLDMAISEVFRLGIEAKWAQHKQNVYADADDLKVMTYKARMSWYFGQ